MKHMTESQRAAQDGIGMMLFFALVLGLIVFVSSGCSMYKVTTNSGMVVHTRTGYGAIVRYDPTSHSPEGAVGWFRDQWVYFGSNSTYNGLAVTSVSDKGFFGETKMHTATAFGSNAVTAEATSFWFPAETNTVTSRTVGDVVPIYRPPAESTNTTGVRVP